MERVQGEDSGPEASPDGKWIAYQGHDERGYTNDIDSLYLMSNLGLGKRRALKVLRKADTLLVRMPEEFHGWRRRTHQIAQQLYLQAWFEKYRTPVSKQAAPALP